MVFFLFNYVYYIILRLTIHVLYFQAMSFTCFNHVDGPSASEGAGNKAEKEGNGGDGNGDKAASALSLETYAVKLKKADIPEFIDIVKRHMPKGPEGEEAV